MQYAIVNDKKILPTPQATGVCPCCQTDVIAKCGEINVWHWAHRAADCDPWSEPETAWHKDMKNRFPKECQEVVLGCHRADVYSVEKKSPVIELQNSLISTEEIQERENYYQQYIEMSPKKVIWIINGESFADRFYTREKDTYHTFSWYHARKSWSAAQGIVIIHFPEADEFFQIKKSYQNMKYGWGKYIEWSQIERLIV